MNNLIHVVDPFDLDKNQYAYLEIGKTVGNQLGIETEDAQFEVPTVVLINGKPYLREDWVKHVIKERDIITTVTVHGGLDPFTIIIAIVVVALLLAATVLLAPSPSVPSLGNTSSIPEADPVFSITGQQNKKKVGQSVETGFGEFRHWPSYAANPYNSFDGSNNEILKAVLCVGEGKYDVSEVLIEDTPLANFSGTNFVLYQPQATVSLFHPNVETAAEVDSVQLFAPNEPEHESWGTSYVITSVGNDTTKIEYDVQTPRGLFKQGDPLTSLTVNWKVRYRQIDDDGIPTTG